MIERVAAEQDKGDHLAGVRIDGPIEPVATQGPAVLARPAFAEQLALAPAPVAQLVRVQGRQNPTGAVGQFRQVGGFHGGPQGMSGEVGQGAMQGLGSRQARQPDQRSQQRLGERAQMMRATSATPGQRQPDERERQRGDAALGAGQVRLEPQALGVGKQAGEGYDVGRLGSGTRGEYTMHEDRAPALDVKYPEHARFSFCLQPQL
jgi:hypothetical protein